MAKPAPRWFAALYTTHPPAEVVKLVGENAAGEKVEFRLELLQYAEVQRVLLGIVSCEAGFALPPNARLGVKRGRVGAKPPETLQLLGPVTQDVENWPRARWAGFAKGAVRALHEMAGVSEELSPLLPWLAVQLALHGYVHRKEAAKAAQTLGAVTLAAKGPVLQVGDLLVWRDFLARQCDELDGRLRELQRRNPFISGATREQVQRWLKLDHPELAGRILREFCERAGLRVGRSLLGPVVRLGKLHDSVPPRDYAVAQAILQSIHLDQISHKHELQASHPSQLHIAAWLVDAGMIVDCAGYLFTRDDLLEALDKLREMKTNVASAGVRDIKDVLGYPRRKAEALRAFIVQHFGSVDSPPVIRKGGAE